MATRRALLLAAAALALIPLWAGVAEAHGKAVTIALTCTALDPGRPLARTCTASLAYADGDPVAGARLEMTARREGRDEPPPAPVVFRPAAGPGRYAATFTLPAYGTWRLRFAVTSGGTGTAELRQEILPPVPGAAPEVRARLQVVFRFGAADVRNLALRLAHLLAAGTWLALVAVVLGVSLLPGAEQRWRLMARVAALFPRLAGASLLATGLTGMGNAAYNAPAPAPGLLAPEAIARLPFGAAYLGAFTVKMGLMAAVLAATVALALTLRAAYARPVPILAGAADGPRRLSRDPDRRVTVLAAVNVALGVAMLADVLIMGYLHMITHVAATAGQ